MKRVIIIVFTVLAGFLLQTTALQFIALAGVVPNLLIIITAADGYMNGRSKAMFTGVLCGLLMDLMYGEIIGLYTLFFLVIAYLNGLVHKFYFKDDFTIPIILVGISDFLFNLFYYITEFLLRNRLNFGVYLKKIIIPEMIYTILVSIVIYKVLHSVNSWLEKSAA